MAGALVVAGFLGAIGCVIWLIVTLFTHHRKRWPAIGIGVGVVMLIVGAVLLPRPSALEMGVSRWEERDYGGAKEQLSQIDKNHEDYDSAQKLLERLPDTAFTYYVEQAEENLKVEEFEKAIRNCNEALRYQPDNSTVLKLKAQIGGIQKKALIAEEEAARKAAAEEAKRQKIEEEAARKVAAEEAKRQKIEEEAAKLATRKAFASTLEETYLDNRMDVTVTTLGQNATTLKMKFVLFSRVDAHELSKDTEFFQMLRGFGFKKFIMTDGYDFTWVWNL